MKGHTSREVAVEPNGSLRSAERHSRINGYGSASPAEVLLDAPEVLDREIDLDAPVLPSDGERAYPQVHPLRPSDEAPVAPDDSIPAVPFYKRLARLLTMLDAACILVSIGLVLAWSNPVWSNPGSLAVALVVLVAGWIGIFRAYGLHTPHLVSGPEEFKKVLSAASVGALFTGLVLAGSGAVSARTIVVVWAIAIVLEMTVRRVARWRVAKLRKDGRILFRTVIVGTNDEAKQLETILRSPALGYRPIGFVSADSGPASEDDVLVLGHVRHLHDLLWEQDVECIFVASSAVAPKDMLKVTQAARQGGADVRISANVPDLFFSRLAVQSMGDLTSLTLRPVRLSGGQALAKRVVDVVTGTLALIVSLPVLAVVAIAIKRGSKGPILFKQKRVTRGGRVFTMLKFRTMVEAADAITDEQDMDVSEPFFKVDDDPRLTAVGRFIRRYSLDELPQLVNVLRGEMSIVGPRPLPAEQVAANLELLAPRHEVRAGMTGWWQTNGRSSVGPFDSVRLDLFYIENWSLALDLYILLKTIGAVVSSRGAY